MIETDAAIPGGNEGFCNGFGLLMAGLRVGQRVFVDEALMLLEAWNMGVSEDGKTIRPQGDRGPNGFAAGGDCLVRQAVDEVEINAADIVAP